MGNKGTYIVEIDIDAAVVCKHKVADRIGALYGLGVVFERIEEPRVFCCYELARPEICPKLY